MHFITCITENSKKYSQISNLIKCMNNSVLWIQSELRKPRNSLENHIIVNIIGEFIEKMRINTIHFKKLDWVLIGAVVLITCFGLAAIWSTGLAKDDFSNFIKQSLFFVVGLSL